MHCSPCFKQWTFSMERNVLACTVPIPRALGYFPASISICFQFFLGLNISFSVSWSVGMLGRKDLSLYINVSILSLFWEKFRWTRNLSVACVSFSTLKMFSTVSGRPLFPLMSQMSFLFVPLCIMWLSLCLLLQRVFKICPLVDILHTYPARDLLCFLLCCSFLFL